MTPKITIASPCSADWEQMAGDERVRFCSECNLNVYNFSAMTTREVESLLASREGRLCARLYRRQDGTILTQDCPSSSRVVVRRVSRVAGAALSAMMTLSPAAAQTAQQTSSSLVQIESNKAELVVTVTDSSGAVIPNAHVVLVNDETKATSSEVTGPSGNVRVSNLAAGSYSLTIQATNFRPAHQMLKLSGHQSVQVKVEVDVQAMMGVVVTVEGAGAVEPPGTTGSIPEQPASNETNHPTAKSAGK